jgi:hypothetical protein
MRDVVAALVAVGLLIFAALLAISLHLARARRDAARRQLEANRRRLVAELPLGAAITIVSEDADAFYYGDVRIDKASLHAARLLLNDTPLAVASSNREPVDARTAGAMSAEAFERDRWDVALETDSGTVVIHCGGIRERVSQDLARRIFEAAEAVIRARG